MDPFDAVSTIDTDQGLVTYYSLDALERLGLGDVSRLPFSIKVLLEASLRNLDGFGTTEDHVRSLAAWHSRQGSDDEVSFTPSRVVLQDFTGVPAVVDLAALRSATARLGADPQLINPHVPVDLVIDHSVQVDAFGSLYALLFNAEREFERNQERYEFLHWGKGAFDNFRVVPPSSGIVHQVNLEHLASVVNTRDIDGQTVAFPDSLVGTDSHTTMVNGLGVVGWGVGGIEAEAVMLGQPLYMLMPAVVGLELTGRMPEGVTATDVVLTVTELLRGHGVVGKFVEFFGDGLDALSLPDRATLANMAPEYGATMGFFPVDGETLRFLERTGRGASVDLVERYCREQGMFREDGAQAPNFSETIQFDMGTVVPSLAGPKRPQDRVPLADAKRAFQIVLEDADASTAAAPVEHHDARFDLTHGSVVIAAITSCTNTSNPSVMIAAGLLAKKAVEAGLASKPWVKTSFAPGSRVVTRYLERAGLIPYLQALGFHVVGYGCTTCIGNSGPLAEPIVEAVKDHDLVVTSVLSGNRNFEGRVSPLTRANYLASPPLVVAYALAGTMDVDLATEPLGTDPTGREVFLADVWPTADEVASSVASSLSPELFHDEYKSIFTGSEAWNAIESTGGVTYDWQPDSTYIREPSFFQDLTPEVPPIAPLQRARVLALLGNSITTDHISPAGAIPVDSPAARYLVDQGVSHADFNSFGSRRGNHEVMMRGTFGNIRLRNQLAPGTEGGYTKRADDAEVESIYDASTAYQADGVPLIVLAGKEYGTGSSRDWAAKGTMLLGVKAVIAQSYERIHRSNLVGMGVLPLQFADGLGWQELELTGFETYDIELPEDLKPGSTAIVMATADDGQVTRFQATIRLDSPVDVRYYRNGGILHTVLRDMVREATS